MIMDKYIQQSKSERLEKFQRQSTGPFSPVSSSPSTREVQRIIMVWLIELMNFSFDLEWIVHDEWVLLEHQQLMKKVGEWKFTDLSSIIVFEDIEEENDHQNQERTPTEQEGQLHHDNPLTNPNLQSMKTSTDRVADWKLNCTLIKSRIDPRNDDDPEIYSTWF